MRLTAMLRCRRQLSTGKPPAGTLMPVPGGERPEDPSTGEPEGAPMRAATEGNLRLVMPKGNLVQAPGCVLRRQGN